MVVDFWSNRKPLSKPQPLKNKAKPLVKQKRLASHTTIH
nr:MAG TPA: hypothetical protein [Caudoviricetes sp.]